MTEVFNPRSEHPAAPRQSSGTSLALWRTVRKHWILVVAITIVVSLAVAFYTLSQTKIYEASTTIQIDPSPARPLGTEVQGAVDMGGAYWSNKEYFDTQLKIIQSRRVAERAVRLLGLHRDAGFLGNVPAGVKPAPREATLESAAQTLRSRLLVEPERNTRLVRVSVEDADPARAARLVTALVEAYTQMNLDDAIASSGNAGDWLHVQMEKLKIELEESELSLHRYKKDKNILSVSIDDQSNMLRAEMTLLNGELTKARTRREAIAARVAQLAKVNHEDPADVPPGELLSNPVLTNLRAQYLDARRALEGLTAGRGRGEKHPEVIGAVIMRDMTRDALITEIGKVREAVGSELAVLQREIGGLAGLFNAAESRALDLNLLEIEYNRLARSKLNTEKLYGFVLERAKASDLTHVMHFNNIRVVDAAMLPRRPVRPQVPVSLAIGLVAGLALGLGAAFSRELLDRTIKMPEDIERDFGFTYLGLLPLTGAPRSGLKAKRRRAPAAPAAGPLELLAHAEPASGLAEASRTVRTNILFMSPDRPYRRLLVTSAGAAEGKTTVACCIAVTMAQAGQRVLLMDCDLRRPRLHRVFGRTNDVGVSNILIGEAPLASIDMRTEVPNLFVLTAGPLAPSPAELLQSGKFADLMAELSNRFDRIIIDSPPLVPVTDAAVLSTMMDGTVLVVRAFQTSRDLLWQATRALRDVGAHVVGCLLNAVDLSRSDYSYYQYYAYKKEGYAKPKAENRASA